MGHYLVSWVSLFCGQSDTFFGDCIAPLYRLTQWWFSIVTLFALTFIILQFSLFFSELFGNEMLAYLIVQPFHYLNSAQDFLDYRKEYNFSFASLDTSLLEEFSYGIISRAFDSALTEIADQYETYQSGWTDKLMEVSSQRNYVTNLGFFGCEAFILYDPLWHTKQYHCMSQKSPPSRTVIAISRNFMGHPARRKVVKLLRHIEEAHLKRWFDWTDSELYHLRSMPAEKFELHADSITALGLDEVTNILLNMVYIYSAIGALVVLLPVVRLSSSIICAMITFAG